jgi:very-short-patch-repair endonuclease
VCAEVVVSGRRDERIRAITQVQKGCAARRQLLSAGISYGVIARRVQSGRLLELPSHVLAVPGTEELPWQKEAAALLATSFDAALSGPTAAVMWNLIPERLRPDRVHVLAPITARTRLPGVKVKRSRTLTAADVTLLQGLPVTTPARTMLELHGHVTERQYELAFDNGLVHGSLRRHEVDQLLKRCGPPHGAPQLAGLLEREGGTTITRSQAEELFVDLFRRADLPPPEVNARLAGFEVDFLWRRERVVVEIDGYRFHHTRRAFEHDREKDARLRAAGFIVLRVSYAQLTNHPYAVLADVVRVLAQRAATPPVQLVADKGS